MKHPFAIAALSLGLATLPLLSQADGRDEGWHGHGDGHGYGYGHERERGDWGGGEHRGYREHDGYRGEYDGDHHGAVFDVLTAPLVLGAAAIGAVATVITAPLVAVDHAIAPPPPYAGDTPGPVYDDEGDQDGPQTCTEYADGSSVCR